MPATFECIGRISADLALLLVAVWHCNMDALLSVKFERDNVSSCVSVS